MDTFELREIASIIGATEIPEAAGGSRIATRASTDSRSVAPGDVFFALEGERFDGHDFVTSALEAGASCCVVRRDRVSEWPGAAVLGVDDTLRALESLAIENRRRSGASVVAITGSVGKTTTKDFLRAILAERFRVLAAPRSFNNRVGVALTLLAADPSTEYLVVEMGTSGHGEIAHLSRVVQPERAILTHIAPAHLSGLGDLDGVIEAKAEIFVGLRGRAWIHRAVPRFEEIARRAPHGVQTFGWECGEFAVESCRPLDPPGAVGYAFRLAGIEGELELRVLGRHNVVNATAAIAVARDIGLEWNEIRRGLARCGLPPGRLELEVSGGVRFVDDSYNANPASMASAFAAWSEIPGGTGRRVVVLGDMLELGDGARAMHEDVGRRLAEIPLDLLVTLGDESRHLGSAWTSARRGAAATAHFENPDAATTYLEAFLAPGDEVFLKGSNASGVGTVAERLRHWAREERVTSDV